jgi:hypothetical protein
MQRLTRKPRKKNTGQLERRSHLSDARKPVIEWLPLLSPWLALACLIVWDARIPQSVVEADSKQKASSPDFIALIDTIRREGQANREEESQEDRGKRFREYLTLLFVIATTAGVFYQAYIFSGQLTEMKSSGEQTAKLIENNAALAASATKQAEAADKQANAMNAAVEVSRESLVAAGRAWVGPRLAKMTGPLEIGKPVELSIEYANTGREPALDFVYSTETFSSSDAEEKRGATFAKTLIALEACKARDSIKGGQVAFPSTGFSSYNLTVTTPNQPIDQEIIDGQKTLFIQGCFLYRSFNIIRHSYFCYFYRAKNTKLENLNICSAGHYAD